MTRALLVTVLLAALSGCHASGQKADEVASGHLDSASAESQPASFSSERFCQGSLPPNRVVVVPKEAAVSESNEHSISSLTFSRSAYHKGQLTLGTTETVFQLDMNAALTSRSIPGTGESCSRVGINVVVSMPFHVINIGRELRPGTCAYEKVREHEYRHVEVNRNTLYNATEVLQQEMTNFFGQRVFYGDPAELREQLQEALRSHWRPRLEALKKAGLADHEAIDTEDEYASNNTDCDAAIPAILRNNSTLDSLRKP